MTPNLSEGHEPIGLHQLHKILSELPEDYYAVTNNLGNLVVYDEYGSYYGYIDFKDGELYTLEDE